jgi:hypothetical protein
MSLQAHSPHSQLITTATLAASAVAAVGVLSLTALQSDACSRLVLTPPQLQAKRCSEYQYKWQQAMDRANLQLQYCWAGGVSQFDAETEQIMTDIFLQEAEIIDFIEQTLLVAAHEMVVGRIGIMEGNAGAASVNFNKEYYIWFYRMNKSTSRIYQVPLGLLGRLLADRLERSVTRTTFCFVADASSGAAVETLVDLVHCSGKASTVLTVREPLWMVVLARLVEQRVLAPETLSKCVFALARLEALKVQDQDTVLITVPQAIVPVILPVLQQVFPDDRHVFAYTGCIPAVQTALYYRRAKAPRAVVPDHMSQAVRFTNPVAITTPMSSTVLSKSTNVMEPFARALQALPVRMADVTETWMAAVDAFFIIKEDETKNGYLPYVFRLDYMVQKPTTTTTTAADDHVVVDATSDCYWSAMSLLQFVTGSRSRQVTSETTDAVLSWLRDIHNAKNAKAESSISVSARHQTSIENCVFQHKLILIANKTLKDTVQPAQHWTLKAAAKRGCACCAPEDEDEDDTTNQVGASGGDFAMNSTVTGILDIPSKSKGNNINYVDGKSTFAFDPSKFK